MAIIGGLICAVGSIYVAIGLGIIVFGICIISTVIKRN